MKYLRLFENFEQEPLSGEDNYNRDTIIVDKDVMHDLTCWEGDEGFETIDIKQLDSDIDKGWEENEIIIKNNQDGRYYKTTYYNSWRDGVNFDKEKTVDGVRMVRAQEVFPRQITTTIYE